MLVANSVERNMFSIVDSYIKLTFLIGWKKIEIEVSDGDLFYLL